MTFFLKNLRFFSASTLALIALPFFMAATAQAQSAPAAVVLVNMQRLVGESAAGKYAYARLKPKIDALQAREKQLEQKFKSEEKSLLKMRDQANKGIMSPDVFQAKVEDYDKRKRQAAKTLQDQQVAIERSRIYATQQIQQQALKVIEPIMRRRGASIVLSSAAAVLNAKSVDITADAIVALDKTLKSVSMTPPVQNKAKKKRK